MVADTGRMAEPGTGEPESKHSLWRAVRRLFEGGEPESLRAQIEEAIAEHDAEQDSNGGKPATAAGDLSPMERLMLSNLLHFAERDADDIAIPRGAIVALPITASWDEVVAAFAEHGHSRLPVHGDTLDEIRGMILMKDVFPYLVSDRQPPEDWRELMREPLFVPQARGALDVLADMRSRRVHLAVVVDEYSGTDGIITFEDLVEEIIGEIEDEHDDAPEDLLTPLDEGRWDADARVLLDEVGRRVDQRLGEVEEDVDTLGGLTFLLAGHVPPAGTVVEHDSGWRIEVTEGDERHVIRLRLHPPVTPVEGN